MRGDGFSVLRLLPEIPQNHAVRYQFCVNESSPRKTESCDNRNAEVFEGTENPASKGVFRTVLNCNTYHIQANVEWLIMLTL